jgi:MtN3 and saliva related transmembrane protein
MDYWNIIGFTASILSAATFVPQVYKALKTKHLRDVSWGLLLLVDISSVLWLIYGIKFQLQPLILSSAITIFSTSLLVVLKLVYKR